jgi:Uma2 family endonuclease
MAPASYNHEMIAGNIDRALTSQVARRGCRSHRDAGLAASNDADFLPEPDVMVRCGPMDGRRRWVSDPIVVIEVLSPSTMADDRGYKLKAYQEQFASLRHIALVYRSEIRVELWSRELDGTWAEEPAVLRTRHEQLALGAVEAQVSLSEIYEGIAID